MFIMPSLASWGNVFHQHRPYCAFEVSLRIDHAGVKLHTNQRSHKLCKSARIQIGPQGREVQQVM